MWDEPAEVPPGLHFLWTLSHPPQLSPPEPPVHGCPVCHPPAQSPLHKPITLP